MTWRVSPKSLLTDLWWVGTTLWTLLKRWYSWFMVRLHVQCLVSVIGEKSDSGYIAFNLPQEALLNWGVFCVISVALSNSRNWRPFRSERREAKGDLSRNRGSLLLLFIAGVWFPLNYHRYAEWPARASRSHSTIALRRLNSPPTYYSSNAHLEREGATTQSEWLNTLLPE